MTTPFMKPENFFVNDDIHDSLSLPPSAFASQEFLAAEEKTVFQKNWLMLPEVPVADFEKDKRSLVQRVSQPTSHAPLELFGRPLFLKRDEKGTLRLFPNVCSHAWYPLVSQCGQSKALICGQHGRKFSDQGVCQSQFGFEQRANFPTESDDLKAMALAQLGPWLFTCFEETGLGFEELSSPIHESLSRMDVESWVRALGEHEERIVPGNWKQHAWNYMDKFHIPFIHRGPRGLIDAIDYRNYQTEIYSGCALQWAYAKNPEHGFNPEQLPDRFRDSLDPTRRVFALWWFIFPNLTLNIYPWGASINRYEPVAGRPEVSRFFWHHFVMEQNKYEQRDTVWLNGRVDAEDVDALELVGRGIRSGFAQPGKFAPVEEVGPHWFHRQVFENVFAI